MFWDTRKEEETFSNEKILQLKTTTVEQVDTETLNKRLDDLSQRIDLLYRYVSFLSSRIDNLRKESVEEKVKKEKEAVESLKDLSNRIKKLREKIEGLKSVVPEIELEEAKGKKAG
jgi:prefoldin subunit 5